MLSQEQATQTEQVPNRNCVYFGLTSKNFLQFISSLILPLMLGIFTVVITFDQQKMARQQRLEDKNESQLQREQTWNIAQMAQAAQNKATNDRYQDEVFVAYIKEMGDLLEKKNTELTSDQLTRTLARVKTLNTIRQLDGIRQMHILRFLYEARLLTNTNGYIALDISTAELTGTIFGLSGRHQTLQDISLAGVILVNSTFGSISLFNVNFSSIWVENANFSSDIRLEDINFSSTVLKNVNFSSATLENVTFSSATLSDINFSPARLSNINFSSTRLKNVNFSYAALFFDVNFPSARLENVNFASATLFDVNFSSAELLSDVNFSSAELFNVSFSSTELSNVNFLSAKLRNVEFSSLRCFDLISFNRAKMGGIIFETCHFQRSDFSYANLKNSSFHGVTWTEAKFSFANLQNADLTETTITDEQLQSALSIRNAKLPNGTLGQGRNLVQNGDANCNILLAKYWQVQNGTITIVTTKEDPSECQFSVTTEAIMSQRITLTSIWDSSFWTSSTVEFQAQMSSGVSIELLGKNSNGKIVSKHIGNATVNKRIMQLEEDMHELEIVVKFNVQQNKSSTENSWCDNIELFVDYDTT